MGKLKTGRGEGERGGSKGVLVNEYSLFILQSPYIWLKGGVLCMNDGWKGVCSYGFYARFA